MATTIGDYEIYEELGHGAAATVYRAFDTHTGQVIALKVLRLSDGDDPERVLQRLGVEARIANQLDHKNIVRVYEHGRSGDSLYIAMEYVNGETLAKRLRREFQLPEAEAHRISLEIARALDAAYQRSVVHRDIKPGNVLLSRTGDVKVADFGIARAIGARTDTNHGSVAGTLMYMAPELWDRDQDNIRVDLYALGVVMYEMLTGLTPYDTRTDTEVIKRKLSAEPDMRPLRSASPTLAPIVERLLRRKPEERFATPASLIQALEAVTDLQTEPISNLPRPAPVTDSLGGRRSTFSRLTQRYQLPLAGLVALTGIGVGILGFTGGFGGDDEDAAPPTLVAPGAPNFSTGSAESPAWQVYLPRREADGSIARVIPDDLEPGEEIDPRFLYPVLDRPLGDAQVVCLSADVPANCPEAALVYGRGRDGGWEIPDEVRREANWIWAPRISPDDPADGEAYVFKTSVKATEKTRRVSLAITADNRADVFIAGEYWFSTEGPNTVTFFNIHSAVNEYLNEDVEIMVLAYNEDFHEGNCSEAPCTYRRNPAGFVMQGPREWIYDTDPDQTN